MGDLTNPRVIWLKGFLFLGIGIISAALLVLQRPEFTTILLLGVTIWAFCRAYYFAFYVIEKYVDSSYRFAGLTDFLRYALGSSQASRPGSDTDVNEP
jgi:hypothetical protein